MLSFPLDFNFFFIYKNWEKINVVINPSNASEKEVNFTSSNKDVLTVSSVGIIKAKHKGTALVTVSVKNHNDYKMIINVK